MESTQLTVDDDPCSMIVTDKLETTDVVSGDVGISTKAAFFTSGHPGSFVYPVAYRTIIASTCSPRPEAAGQLLRHHHQGAASIGVRLPVMMMW
jgi:hypothetical protein